MRRKLAALLMLGAILMTACGGGDDGTPADAGAGADGGAGAETGPGGDTDVGGDGGVGAIDATRCAELLQAMAAASAAAIPGAGSASDLETTVAQLEAMAEVVPEEIRDDMRTVAEAYAVIVQAYSESGYDPTSGEPPTAEQIAALTAAAEQLEDEDFVAASERVSVWFETECGTA
jgi:hypothetical protein